MSNQSAVRFPSPIGGVALPIDFAPSVVFAVLYGLLAPLVIYRILHRRSRTTLLIGTIIFSMERIAIFSLRAVQSHNTRRRLSKGLAKYMQISFGLGYIGIANDIVNLIRCLLVNPTYGPERYPESAAASTKECHLIPPQEGDEDQPRQRFWARRFTDFSGLAFLAASVPGAVSASMLTQDFNQKDADKSFTLRYASSAVALFLIVALACVALLSFLKQKRAGKRGVYVIWIIAFLTGVIATYRLCVMYNRTTAFDSLEPGSLNSTRSKLRFYILHVLPEWLASFVLLGIDVRKTFGTGLAGDWRFRDETEVEKARRQRSAAARKANKESRQAIELKEKEKEPASLVVQVV